MGVELLSLSVSSIERTKLTTAWAHFFAMETRS